MMKRFGLWLPPLLYMALIFHFSSESDPLPEVTHHLWDKLLHTVEYGGLGLLFCRALSGEGIRWIRAVVVAIVLTSIYGATDEGHQSFVPQRTADVRDWFADNVGAMLGAGSYAVAMVGRRERR
jgi:VanZ family protein